MLLKTQIFEKTAVFPEKNFWSKDSRFIECEKPQRSISMSPKAILTNTVELGISFLLQLRSC